MCSCDGDVLCSDKHPLESEAGEVKLSEPRLKTADFDYTPLDDAKGEIRLLRIIRQTPDSKDPIKIKCEVFHASLAAKPLFMTLSYTWGSSDDPHHTILLNGKPFLVRQNLYDALNEFSSWGWRATPIWIDAICIDQKNNSERSQQVSQMKKIYEQAVEVTVWLGLHYDDSHAAFQCMKDILDFANHEHSVWAICTYLEDTGPVDNDQEVLSARGLKALSDLLTRDYWNRMWVVQEITVAKNIVIRMPGCAVAGDAMLKVQRLLCDAHQGTNGFPFGKLQQCLDNDPFPMNALIAQGLMSFKRWQDALASGGLTFHDYLRYHSLAQASDPRDKLYALAALAEGKVEFTLKIDYGATTSKVYTDFARSEIEAYKNLDILTSVHIGSEPNFEGLPTWAPSWSSPNLRFHNQLRMGKLSSYSWRASKDVEARFRFVEDAKVLCVKGVRIGNVVQLGQRTNMTDHEEHGRGLRALYGWWLLHISTCPQASHTDCVERFIAIIECHTILDEANPTDTLRWRRQAFAELFTLYKMYRKAFPDDFAALDDATDALRHEIFITRAKEAEEEGWVFKSTEDASDQELRRKTYRKFLQMWDRRYAILGEGLMGLVPDVAVEGDVVCVLLGCPHPMVLRKVEEGWEVVGEAYVDGYMYGEAVEQWQAGDLLLEEFELR